MEIELRPKEVAGVFVLAVFVLSVMNGVSLGLYFFFIEADVYLFSDYFDFGVEGNVPTFYSAFAILVCSGLLALITRARWDRPDGKRNYWLGLSLIFFFLAFDEAAEIHEFFSDYMEQYMVAAGPLYYLWVVPYGVAVIVIGLVYLRFVWALPRVTRLRFIGAGCTFIGGAVGVEMASANVADLYDTDSVAYSMLYTIEETLEMLGIVWFMYALLDYLAEETGGVVVRLSGQPD